MAAEMTKNGPGDEAVDGGVGGANAARSGEARPGEARPGEARPGEAGSDVTRTDAARPDAARPDAARPDAARPDAARPDRTRPDATSAAARPSAKPRGRGTLLLILLVALSPILGAVVMYLNPQWWPEDSSNYGELIQPQRELPNAATLPLATLDGQPFDLHSLKGKWLLLTADSGACGDPCARKLYILRNTHASQGKHVNRLARVWFVTDDAPIPQPVLEAYRGTVIVRGRPADLAPFLLGVDIPVPEQAGAALAGPMWVVDPLGHLMLQFPHDADPLKVRGDIRKLISNSRVG